MTYWVHSAPDDMDVNGGQRPCARGEHCAAATVVRDDDGASVREPAYSPRVFCDACRDVVERCLRWLPERYLELAVRLGDRRNGDGPKVSGGGVSSVPLRLDVDALMCDVVSVVASWDERVRVLARLSGPDTAASRRRRETVALSRMCTTLAAHLDALLGLPAEPMRRFVRLEDSDDWDDGDTPVLRHYWAGWAEVIVDLSGADAGEEVIALDRRCRSLLGWTPQHENLPVPCWDCGLRTLRRYDGGAGLEDEAECTNPDCRTRYVDDRFTRLMVDVANARASRVKAS